MKCVAKWVCCAMVVSVGIAAVSQAGVRRHDKDDSLYQNLGQGVGAGDSYIYEGVGQLFVTDAEGGGWWGSGTIIAAKDSNNFTTQRWVLTAAHVLQDADTATFSLQVKYNGAVETRSYYGVQAALATDWDDSVDTWSEDIALLRLNADVYDAPAAEVYSGGAEQGVTATMVGYGTTGTGDQPEWSDETGEYVPGARTFDGVKRAGQNVIDQMGTGYAGGFDTSDPPTGKILRADFDSPDGTENTDFVAGDAGNGFIGAGYVGAGNDPNPLDLEYSSYSGDSGGGVFANIGGQDVLIGVVAHGIGGGTEAVQPFELPYMVADADYGDLMGFTRASQFATAVTHTTTGYDEDDSEAWDLTDLNVPSLLPPMLPGNPGEGDDDDTIDPIWSWGDNPLDAGPLPVGSSLADPVDPSTIEGLLYDALDPTEVLPINNVAQNLLDAGLLSLIPYNPMDANAEMVIDPNMFWRVYSQAFGSNLHQYMASEGYYSQFTPIDLPVVTEVPEPASLALLAAGGLMLWRRRR